MKPLILYHDNCADGFGAAFAAWMKFGDKADYIPCQYDKLPVFTDYNNRIKFGDKEYIIKMTEFYILDFSFPKEIMNILLGRAEYVTWLDHHKSAFEMWCEEYKRGMQYCLLDAKYKILLDDNKSGAMLAWEHFRPNYKFPKFIRHIDDYDRWQFKLEGTKEFNKALWSHAPWSFKQWKEFFFHIDEGIHDKLLASFYLEGQALLRDHNQKVADMVKKGEKCLLRPLFSDCLHDGLIVNCPSFLASDVGDELSKTSGTFGLTWMLEIKDRKQIAKCSIRSNGDYDVSSIARAFGGGGHLNASGFSVPITTLLGWIK